MISLFAIIGAAMFGAGAAWIARGDASMPYCCPDVAPGELIWVNGTEMLVTRMSFVSGDDLDDCVRFEAVEWEKGP